MALSWSREHWLSERLTLASTVHTVLASSCQLCLAGTFLTAGDSLAPWVTGSNVEICCPQEHLQPVPQLPHPSSGRALSGLLCPGCQGSLVGRAPVAHGGGCPEWGPTVLGSP